MAAMWGQSLVAPATSKEVVAYDMPNPELAAAVQDSLVTLDALMTKFPLASRNFDSLIQWTAALQKWRADLFLAHGYLAAAGFDVPSWDMDLEATPSLFVNTWRDYLAKVWPAVDPTRAGSFYVVQ